MTSGSERFQVNRQLPRNIGTGAVLMIRALHTMQSLNALQVHGIKLHDMQVYGVNTECFAEGEG